MKRRRWLFAGVLLSGVLLLSILGPAGSAVAGTRFVVNMDGSQVPGGDSDGQGRAFIDVTPETGTVCFRVVVRNLVLPTTDAHIHLGDPGVDGPVVVRMAGPDSTATSRGCTTGWDTTLLQDIIDNPGAYYVNVHTSDFPAGAIRGQMG